MNFGAVPTYIIIAITNVMIITLVLRRKKHPLMAEVTKPIPAEPEANYLALTKKVRRLESEQKALRLELWKYKRKPLGKVGYVLLGFGAIALISSIVYSSFILAFIGIALTFWGALFLYIRPTRYVKSSLLDSTVISLLTTLDQRLAPLTYGGRGIYLPPRYLKDFKAGMVFIPLEKAISIPLIEEVAEVGVFLRNPEGIYLTPPGLSLANLYEEELGTDFTKVGLDHLQDNLRKLFIEGLEIAEDFELSIEGDIVHVKIIGSIYKDICNEARKLSNICPAIGCPLCSSIAIVLSRTTGKPITIEKNIYSADGSVVETYYRILEE